VNKTVGYALDSRDPVATLAKKVGTEVPLFKGRVNRTSNSLPRSSANVITLNTLVECTRVLAAAWLGVQDRRKLELAVGEDQSRVLDAAIAAWSGIIAPFQAHWQPVLDAEPGATGRLRDDYVFPHGLGWLVLATLAGELFRGNAGDWPARFAQATASVDWSRNNKQWEGIATLRGSVNNTAPAVKATTMYLLDRCSITARG
ncbi:MAG: hypothetical protein NTY23_12430, partial [Chloroflexi bacterium]|nr:hypothetical protein [Chloroflexota bacterium]